MQSRKIAKVCAAVLTLMTAQTAHAAPEQDSATGTSIDAQKPASLDLLNPNDVIMAQDYPLASIRDGIEGNVTVKLIAGPDAKVLDCQIMSSSGSKVLDDLTCTLLMERGKFAVIGSANEPDGRYSMPQKIRWQIPATASRALFLGVTLTDSKPVEGDRLRCQFSDGVILFVAKGATCVTKIPMQTITDGDEARSVNIIDRYIALNQHDPKPEYALEIATILGANRYGQSLDYLAQASDEGSGLASTLMCAVQLAPQNALRNTFDPKQAVRRCLLAQKQGMDIGMLLIRQYMQAHPDVATDAQKQFISSYVPNIPIYTSQAVLTVPGDNLIRSQDYPKEALKQNIQGQTVAMYHVTAQGRIDDCFVMLSSLSFELDDVVCRRLTEGGTFTPAIALGEPTASWQTTTVKWQIGGNNKALGGAFFGALLGAIVGHAL